MATCTPVIKSWQCPTIYPGQTNCLVASSSQLGINEEYEHYQWTKILPHCSKRASTKKVGMHMLGKARLGKSVYKPDWERQSRDSLALLEIVEESTRWGNEEERPYRPQRPPST